MSIEKNNLFQLSAGQSLVALIGRILLSLLFILSGFSKISAFSGMVGYAASMGLPLPSLAISIAIVIEVLGSIVFILGYKTKLMSLLFFVFTLVTAFIFHNNLGDQMQFINFFKNVSIAGGFLTVYLLGAGRYSLDAKLNK